MQIPRHLGIATPSKSPAVHRAGVRVDADGRDFFITESSPIPAIPSNPASLALDHLLGAAISLHVPRDNVIGRIAAKNFDIDRFAAGLDLFQNKVLERNPQQNPTAPEVLRYLGGSDQQYDDLLFWSS